MPSQHFHSPAFDHHVRFLEQLVADTPSPVNTRDLKWEQMLTCDDSPTDHILRGAKSFAARSNRSFHSKSSNTLRIPSGTTNDENRSTNTTDNTLHAPSISGEQVLLEGRRVLGEVANNNQTLRTGFHKPGISPTPSLRKKKAEAILKEHSSPPGVRVTAGGRIVPSDQSPLCHPRYGYSAIKANDGLIKFSPNHPAGGGQFHWDHALASQNGFIAQDVQGRLCQIVDGTIMPLNEVDGALRLYMAAPNLQINQRNGSLPPAQRSMSGNCIPVHGRGFSVQQQSGADPTIPAQIQALDREYAKLDRDLKELDKAEVLQRDSMSKPAHAQLVQNRRQLVVALDSIRKALKSIRTMAPPNAPTNAPTAPRAMNNQRSLQGQARISQPMPSNVPVPHPMQMPQPVAGSIPQFYYPPIDQDGSTPFGFAAFMDPTAALGCRSFSMPGNVPPYLPHMDLGAMPLPIPQYVPTEISPAPEATPTTPPTRADAAIPGDILAAATSFAQTDGARSYPDLKASPQQRQSRALQIKVPEPKVTGGVRSGLNPMSPAYKPGTTPNKSDSLSIGPTARSVKDRPPTPLPSLNAPNAVKRQDSVVDKTSAANGQALNHEKISNASHHGQSSSTSSFATADFFPRNPREYSTNKHKYPQEVSDSEDKENVNPVDYARLRGEDSTSSTNRAHYAGDWSPGIQVRDYETVSPASTNSKPPIAPPGTPVVRSDDTPGKTQASRTDTLEWQRQSHGFDPVPDRTQHNLSPKNKRQDWLFVQEDASEIAALPSSSPRRLSDADVSLEQAEGPQEMLDFTQKSREFLEGFRAGLARSSVSYSRMGDYMDGYCAGLLKSAPMGIGSSNGSPMKQTTRRPSPAVSRNSSRLQMDRRDFAVGRPPLELSIKSLDTMKQAVFAPQNENAILSPAEDGPHIQETGFNLGGWARAREESNSTHSMMEQIAMHRGDGNAGFPFSQRTSSMVQRQVASSKMMGIENRQDSSVAINSKRTFSGNPYNAPPPTLLTTLHSGNQMPLPKPSKGQALHGNTSYPSQADGPASARSVSGMSSNLYRHYPGSRVFSPHLEWKSASSIAQVGAFAAGSFSQYDGAHESVSAARYRAATLTDASSFIGAPKQHASTNGSTSVPAEVPHNGRFLEHSVDGGPSSPPMSPVASPSASPKRQNAGKSSPARAKFEAIAGKVGIKTKKEDEASPEKEKTKWRDLWRRNNVSKDSGDTKGKDESAT